MVDVLFTDEFEIWWDGLTAEEQGSVNATVILLGNPGQSRSNIRTVRKSQVAVTPTCGNCGFNTKADPTA